MHQGFGFAKGCNGAEAHNSCLLSVSQDMCCCCPGVTTFCDYRFFCMETFVSSPVSINDKAVWSGTSGSSQSPS